MLKFKPRTPSFPKRFTLQIVTALTIFYISEYLHIYIYIQTFARNCWSHAMRPRSMCVYMHLPYRHVVVSRERAQRAKVEVFVDVDSIRKVFPTPSLYTMANAETARFPHLHECKVLQVNAAQTPPLCPGRRAITGAQRARAGERSSKENACIAYIVCIDASKRLARVAVGMSIKIIVPSEQLVLHRPPPGRPRLPVPHQQQQYSYANVHAQNPI